MVLTFDTSNLDNFLYSRIHSLTYQRLTTSVWKYKGIRRLQFGTSCQFFFLINITFVDCTTPSYVVANHKIIYLLFTELHPGTTRRSAELLQTSMISVVLGNQIQEVIGQHYLKLSDFFLKIPIEFLFLKVENILSSPYTEYEFGVLAMNNVGRGQKSVPVFATTGETSKIILLVFISL